MLCFAVLPLLLAVHLPHGALLSPVVSSAYRYVGANGSCLRLQAWLEHCSRVIHLDCKTRWSSTAQMLEVALSLRRSILLWWANLDDTEDQAAMLVTEPQWEEVKLLLELFKPFAVATDRAASSAHSISVVLPLYNSLYFGLHELAADPKFLIFKEGIEEGMRILTQYYGYTGPALAAATVLDPRANFNFFSMYDTCAGHETVAQAQTQARALLAPYLSANVPAAEPESEEPEEDIFGRRPAVVDDELVQYAREPKLAMKADPLAWWKANESRFPKLAVAARDLLAARATSAPSERAFSAGRQVVSEFRKSMSATHIRDTVLSKSWMRVLDDEAN